jgi:hypothetical protein
MTREEIGAAASKAAANLCHLSMVYVGSFIECITGKKIVGLPQSHPGLHEMRDLINLLLITRAEINAITKVLLDKKIVTDEEFTKIMTDEYIWFGNEKARSLKVKIEDYGLSIQVDSREEKQN